MTLAGIALQILLAVLLIVALVFGMRLERRLKALKESHEGFAKAVVDLDAAAQRAEQGLADLRAATDEAAEQLADRIEKARILTAKLDKSMAQATRGESARVASNRPPPAPPMTRARAAFAAVDRPPPPVETPRSRPRGEDDDLFDPPAGPGGFGVRPGGRR
jgi:Sec-independent protein translocase protein TatA